MKLNFKMVASILLLGVIAHMMGDAMQEAFGVPTLITQTAVVGGSFLFELWQGAFGNMSGIVKNAIEPEIWHKWIAENIYKNNDFITHSVDVSSDVLSGSVVHIPQSGAASGAEKNRSSLPASVTKRSDTDVTYALDEYTTDPRRVGHTEQIQASYDKMNSVFMDDVSALQELVAENVLVAWTPSGAANIVRTTGADVSPYLPAQTGDRKGASHNDILAMMTKFNANSLPQEGRKALLSAQMYEQVINSLTPTQFADFSKAYDEKRGVLGKLHSFEIMMRSTVRVFDNTATPVAKAFGAAGAATDNDASLFWHSSFVEHAMGEVKVFEDIDNPTYYSSIMSFLIRMGARIRRNDQKGVYALVQAAAA